MSLPKPTTDEAQLSAADEVIVSPDFFARLDNPYGESETPSPAKKGRGRAFKADAEALSLYNGHDGLLVRTALIRPPSYKPGDNVQIEGPRSVERLLAHLKYADQEHMVVLGLNVENKVNAIYEVAIGTAKGVSFQARDVIKVLVLSASLGAVLAHNHPSGNPEPSRDDLETTRVIKASMSCMGYTLLDHVIVASRGITSFFERGLL